MIDSLISVLQSSQLPQYLQIVLIFGLYYLTKGKGGTKIKDAARELLRESLSDAIKTDLKEAVKQGVREGLAQPKTYNGPTKTNLSEVKR